MTTDPWADVPDVSLDGRSLVPYPDPAPESTAAMWEQWRADQAARRAVPVESDDEDGADDVFKNHEPPVVTMAAEEFDDPISTLAGYVKLAVPNGWDLVELAHARCTARGKVIKSGQRAGTRHPDREIETQWVKVSKAGVGRGIVCYSVINGKTDSSRTFRSFNGLTRSDAEMKALLKGEA